MRPFDANDAVGSAERLGCGFEERAFNLASTGDRKSKAPSISPQAGCVSFESFDTTATHFRR
jgi:hypothetical protein